MTTEMKPLEWRAVAGDYLWFADTPELSHLYMADRLNARVLDWETEEWSDVPGPYDGTIETAKQRCEEHRRKRA